MKRSLTKYKDGGTVYKKALEGKSLEELKKMDSEYSKALKEGKDIYTSSVTGLKYKVEGDKDRIFAESLYKKPEANAPKTTTPTPKIETPSTTPAKAVVPTKAAIPAKAAAAPAPTVVPGKSDKPLTSNDIFNRGTRQPFERELKAGQETGKSKSETPVWPKKPGTYVAADERGKTQSWPAKTGTYVAPDANNKTRQVQTWPSKGALVEAERVYKQGKAVDLKLQTSNNPKDATNVVPTKLGKPENKRSDVEKLIEGVKRTINSGNNPDIGVGSRMMYEGSNELYKQAVPTSLRSLLKNIDYNQLGIKNKITEKDLTLDEQKVILDLVNKKAKLNAENSEKYSKSINSYNDYDDEGKSQWSPEKNIRNTLGEFTPVQKGDTAYINDTYNFNEKENNTVQKSPLEWYNHWTQEVKDPYSPVTGAFRAAGSAWGSPGSTNPNLDTQGMPVDIKLYNPQKRFANGGLIQYPIGGETVPGTTPVVPPPITPTWDPNSQSMPKYIYNTNIGKDGNTSYEMADQATQAKYNQGLMKPEWFQMGIGERRAAAPTAAIPQPVPAAPMAYNKKDWGKYYNSSVPGQITGYSYTHYPTGKVYNETDYNAIRNPVAPIAPAALATRANGGYIPSRSLRRFDDGGTWAGVDAQGKPIQTTFGKSTAGSNIATGAGIAGAVVPMITSMIPDQTVRDSEGNSVGQKVGTGKAIVSSAASGAAMGASFGGPVGALIGAGAGAIYGGISNSMANNKIDAEMKQANSRISNRKLDNRMTTNNNAFATQDYNNNDMVYAAGGMVIDQHMDDPNAELELNETFQEPSGQVGMVDGPSHDNGGVEVNLEEGTRIWSDRLKHNGKTFAALTRPIVNKIEKLEKTSPTDYNSRFKQNSKMLLNKQLDHLFEVQETNKQQDEMKRSLKNNAVVNDRGNYHYAMGGYIPKYWDGSKIGDKNLDLYSQQVQQPTQYGMDQTYPTYDPQSYRNPINLKPNYGTYSGVTQYGINPAEFQNYMSQNGMLNGTNRTAPTVENFNAWKSNTPIDPFKNSYSAPQSKISTKYRDPKKVYSDPVVFKGKPGAKINDIIIEPRRSMLANTGMVLNNSAAPGKIDLKDVKGLPTTVQPNNSNNWFKDNANTINQGLTLAGTLAAQNANLNKLPAPKNIPYVNLQNQLINPKYVDMSAERGVIDRVNMGAMDEAQRQFGSSAAAQAFKNKARLNQLEGLGKSYMNQENVNSGIYNQFAGMKGETAIKQAMINNEIDKQNAENWYGDKAMRTSNKNAAIGIAGHGVGEIFGNNAKYSNELDRANILSNQYEDSVLADTYKNNPALLEDAYSKGNVSKKFYEKYKKAYGGVITRRSLKK